MECRPLEVRVISARDLRDVRLIFDMNPYVVASLFRDGRHSNKQRTLAHRDGGTSPRWDHALVPFTVDVAAARAGLLTLKLKIKTKRTLGNRDVGTADVPIGVLLERGGDGRPTTMRCAVRLKSGGTSGVLKFLYRFGEPFNVRQRAPYQPPPNQQPQGPGHFLCAVMIFGAILGLIMEAVNNV